MSTPTQDPMPVHLSRFSVFIPPSDNPDGRLDGPTEIPAHELEVRFLADGQDVLSEIDEGQSGLAPTCMPSDLPELLPKAVTVPAAQLAESPPAPASQHVLIGICGCGVYDCSDTLIQLSATAEVVTWSQIPDPQRPHAHPKRFAFSRPQYESEIARALADFSWEYPQHTIARLVGERINRSWLASLNLAYSYCWPKLVAKEVEVSLFTLDTYHQLFLKFPFAGTTPDAVAAEVLRALTQPPSTWPNVEYIITGCSGGVAPKGVTDRPTPTLSISTWRLRRL